MENTFEASVVGMALLETAKKTASANNQDETINSTVAWMLWAKRNPQLFEAFLQATNVVGDDGHVYSEVERKVAIIDSFVTEALKLA